MVEEFLGLLVSGRGLPIDHGRSLSESATRERLVHNAMQVPENESGRPIIIRAILDRPSRRQHVIC